MFEKWDLSNTQYKWMVAPSSKFYGKIWACFCFNFKTVFPRGFILKPTKRAQIFEMVLHLIDGTFLCDNQWKFWTFSMLYFWDRFCGKWKHFSRNWCTNHFLVESTEIETPSFPYKTAILKDNVRTNRIVSKKWTYHKERNFLPVTFIFWKIQFNNFLQRAGLMYQRPKCPYSYLF